MHVKKRYQTDSVSLLFMRKHPGEKIHPDYAATSHPWWAVLLVNGRANERKLKLTFSLLSFCFSRWRRCAVLKDKRDVWVYKLSRNEVTTVWWSCCCLWTQNIVYPHKLRVGVDGKYVAWPRLKVLTSMKIALPGALLHLTGCESSLFPGMLEQHTKKSKTKKKIYRSYELLCEQVTSVW